jgi:predicted DNA-binding antitoxin AbrB/MazE fold protein
MTRIVEAIYEKGILKLPGPLPLPGKSHFTVTIQSHEDDERATWLKVSKDTLAQAWDSSDDVFNELLTHRAI